MSNINKQALREAAEKATPGRVGDRIDGSGSIKYECHGYDGSLVLRTDHKNMEYGFIGDNSNADELFFRLCVPDVILALLDELEAAEKRIAELEAEPVSQTYKLNELSGNSQVTPDGWISCSERMPIIGELNWRTGFPLLITCEIGVIPAYYGFVSVNGNKHYGFMESLKYGDDNGNHPQTNEYGLISNVTHWMPLPEPPQEVK